MKKHIVIILALLALSFQVFAQDARQRTPQTIVSDVLAVMPAQNQAALQTNMADLAAAAPESVKILGAMLKPASQAANSRVEYALSGLTAYASANREFLDAVKAGLEAAAAAQGDSDQKQFLQTQLRLLGVAPEAEAVPAPVTLAAADVLKAIRSKDRSTRVRALNAAPTDDAFAAKLVGASKAKGAESDILYWLGENGKASQMKYILKQIDGKYAADAIRAASTIGGSDAAAKLCSLLSGDKAATAAAALKYFNGDFSKELAAVAENADPEALKTILGLAEGRHMTSFLDKAVESGNYDFLKGLVSGSDADRMAALLDGVSSKKVKAVSDAYTQALSYSDKPYADVLKAISAAKNPGRFYKAMASIGSNEAADYLSKRYWEGQSALEALAGIDNTGATDVMLNASKSDESYIKRYIELVQGGRNSQTGLYKKYTAVMPYAKSADVKNNVLSAMGGVALPDMLDFVDGYLDDPQTAYSAAYAAKKIMGSCPTLIDNDKLQKVAARVCKVLEAGDADDHYAISEIKNLVESVKVYPVSELTEEEKAMGFEMLYDGTTLDKWTGGGGGYQSVNGVINVTANYGGAGNLYTVGEYRDFIYRFEFCFLEPAVNNGVGVRTPNTGVDAAYDAMCEVQILDHDDPVYAGLREYQVHGSVYGVIPAKRLKHKPIGEWSTEEIEVRGDHVKVTVNGEVILDGDVREACQGHNVAPDGGDVNPYTVDHRNHPGMFNEKGHISFCGHGNGLQFRNVRVLDLSK